MLNKAVVLHHPQSEGAAAFALRISRDLERAGVTTTVGDVWAKEAPTWLKGAGLLLCVGGDGSVLRAARLAAGQGTPILGVNMGRLGFLTDISPESCAELIPRIVATDWRLEGRVMVHAYLYAPDGSQAGSFEGLNDIVVSRQSPGRPIYVDLQIDGARLAVYRCDGMIVATPTGSTGYSLSAGGPILAPTENHLVVTPVSAHLALSRSVVVGPETSVELRVTSDHGAILSVDGQEDVPMASGARVSVSIAEHVAQFVRFRPPSSFYGELADKLDVHLSSPSIRA
ncbi:MAG: NAD(+)/NADH kinase [Dehalococcoidia bacterium]